MTVASVVVDRKLVANPLSFVRTVCAGKRPGGRREGHVTLRERGLPVTSSTRAVIVTVPPLAGTLDGEAITEMRSAAAAPILTWSVSEALPEKAVIVAVPERPSANKVTVARPLTVRASTGSILPSDVVKVTSVPLWTGVPEDGKKPPVPPWLEPLVPFSMSTAMTSVLPLIGRTFVAEMSVMTVPAGAVNGTLSVTWRPARQAGQRERLAQPACSDASAGTIDEGLCSNMILAKDFTFMDLVGQGNFHAPRA